MKQSLTAWGVETHSENWYRTAHRMAISTFTKKQRNDVRELLGKHLRRLPVILPDRTLNLFEVTLTRITIGVLDDDNAAMGALKSIRDEVASWITLDDGRWDTGRIRFKCLQQKCPQGFQGIRIEVSDLSAGEGRHFVTEGAPNRLGAADLYAPGKMPPAPKPTAHEQEPILFRRSFAKLPWDQTVPGKTILTELPPDALANGADAPPVVRVPLARPIDLKFRRGEGGPTSTEINLYRREYNHPAHGLVWLYTQKKPQDRKDKS